MRDLGVAPDISDALAAVGVVDPFPIQSMAVPLGLDGHDVIGQARTGTGKTYAFGIPLLQRIERVAEPHRPRGLVVTPTRELAQQVTDDLSTAGARLGVRVLTVYGGRAYEPQIDALRQGVDVVVGTPGRLLDLRQGRHLDLSRVQVLVLDEADRMLDLGFLPDVERILAHIPRQRQSMLFSATMPGEIISLVRRHLRRPTHVRAEAEEGYSAVPTTAQHVFRAHRLDKPELLARVLQAEGRGLTMVFCGTKRVAARLADDLTRRGFAVGSVHGDLGQGQRERAMRAFRNGKVDVLVATDVAGRGLDVVDVTHVINYECPDDERTYLHRIGRTGRAGRAGVAVTFVDWEDLVRWKTINNALGLPFAELEETYSTSDHVREALGIPADVTGVLPRGRRGRAGLEAEELEDIGETGRIRSRDDERGAARRGRGGPTRQRRRTRAGEPVEQHARSGEAADPRPAVGAGRTEPKAGERRRPRRRRRRPGRSQPADGGA